MKTRETNNRNSLLSAPPCAKDKSKIHRKEEMKQMEVENEMNLKEF